MSMFTTAKQVQQLQKEIATLVEALDAVTKIGNEYRDKAVLLEQALIKRNKSAELIDIRVEGRVNLFTFRKGETVKIVRTYSTTSDNVAEWRELLS